MDTKVFEELQDENKRLRLQLNASTRKNQELNAKCSQLRNLLECTEGEMQKLFDQIKQQSSKVPHFRQRLQEFELQLTESKAREDMLKADILETRDERDKASVSARMLKQELQRVTDTFSSEVQSLSAEKSSVQLQNSSLLNQVEEQKRDFQQRERELEGSLASKERQIESLSDEIKSLASRLQSTPGLESALQLETHARKNLEAQLAQQSQICRQFEQDMRDQQHSFEKKLSIARLEHSKELKSLQLDHERSLRLLQLKLAQYEELESIKNRGASQHALKTTALKSPKPTLESPKFALSKESHDEPSRIFLGSAHVATANRGNTSSVRSSHALPESRAQSLMVNLVEKLKTKADSLSSGNTSNLGGEPLAAVEDDSQQWLNSLRNALQAPDDTSQLEERRVGDQSNSTELNTFISEMNVREKSMMDKFLREIDKLERDLNLAPVKSLRSS